MGTYNSRFAFCRRLIRTLKGSQFNDRLRDCQLCPKLKYNIRDVAKQVCYYYYRKQEVLQKTSIRKQIDKAIDKDLFTLDEDYNGFNGYEKFNPEENISEILVLFNRK